MGPLVSVIIPCFNAERYIGAAIQSALNQSWANIEIIVVDDGSTDSSAEIAKSNYSPRVRILTQSNRGASAARNEGLSLAQGEYIQFLDADDLIAPGKIEAQLKRSEAADKRTLFSGAWARLFENDLNAAVFVEEPIWQDLAPVEWLVTSWLGGGMMHPGAWLTSRALIERAGRWNEALSLNDDGEFFTRVILASTKIVFVGPARSYYRSGLKGTLSSRISFSALQSAYLACQLSVSHLLNVEDSPRTTRASSALYQRFIYAAYPIAPSLVAGAEEVVQRLGPSGVKAGGGIVFTFVRSLLGWKRARKLQHALRRRNLLGRFEWKSA